MTETALKLVDVHKHFGERQLFSGINLTLARGEIAVISGDSGVGKTTLLRAIAGLTSFTGRIEVMGEQVSSAADGAGRLNRVLVLQHANLWDHLTAIDNVALVRRLLHREPKALARREAKRYLELLEVTNIADQYPQSLSGGEQQRISLARGFAAETPLLLLDEVTSQVDLNRRGIIAKAVRSMANMGRSVLFVTHDSVTGRLLGGRSLRLTQFGLQSS